MEIVIDERIELITVVQTICNYWENLQMKYYNEPLCPNKYRENVQEYFGKYKEHKIVTLYNALCGDIEDITAFLNMALCCSNPPEMDVIADYEKNWGKINNTVFPYEEFIDGLRQFYIDTDFKSFYNDNQNEYQNMLNNYGSKTELSVNTAFDYYGYNADNYTVILSSLPDDGSGFGVKLKTNKNEIKNYSIITPYGYKDNNYLFGPIQSKKDLLWHEIGHLTINDLTDDFMKQFDLSEKQVPEIYVKNLYNSIELIINEYIIRAITIRLWEINNERELEEEFFECDIQAGFKHIKLLKDHIKNNYEAERKFVKDNSYKKLMEYVINLI